MTALLERALHEVLACPLCHGPLLWSGSVVACASCGLELPIRDGVLDARAAAPRGQEREQAWRDEIAERAERLAAKDMWPVIARHHAIDLMREKADRLRASLGPDAWLLDIGSGCGWHWAHASPGASVIGIDFSLKNCINARKLLDEPSRALVICANAAAMPLRDAVIAGIWSVQVLQHLPDAVLDRTLHEVGRVSRPDVRGLVINLNPGAGLKLAYRALGRRMTTVDERGPAYLRRRTAGEWRDLFAAVLPGSRAAVSYSELFFHPELRVTPRNYPVRTERALLRLPWVAPLVARQLELVFERRA